MAYKSFRVESVKGLQLAELTSVPNLLVIVGPNGAGKSTLLDSLRSRRGQFTEPGTRVTYWSPNRPWRSSKPNAPSLYGMTHGYRELLELDSMPGFQYVSPAGYSPIGGVRGADTIDDAQGLVKYSIAKIENKRQTLITKIHDDLGGYVPPGSVADVFAPLRKLVETLLPHLQFTRVDMTDQNNIRCLFKKLDLSTPLELDIDDLSSGEKAIISLFLPFIESQIEAILNNDAQWSEPKGPMPTAIIDEPELHLHPALQISLVTYMRELVQQGVAQFIIATHSTTLMDSLEDDELYLLASPAIVGDGNQLSKLSASSERLEAIRSLTGSTYAVTRCRPIVYLEGEPPDERGRVSDQRIIEMLIPEAKSWVLVPCGGRNETIQAASKLREPSLTELPGIPVFALVDNDQIIREEPDYVITWPVCMLENLLLDPEAIWKLLTPQRERVCFSSANDVKKVLTELCHQQSDNEVRLRMRQRIKPFTLHLPLEQPCDFEGLAQRSQESILKYSESLGGKVTVTAARKEVEAEVAQLLASDKHLEKFHGKNLLKAFFEKYVKQQAGFNYPAFVFQLTKEVVQLPRLERLVAIPVRQIRQFVPATLLTNIKHASDALMGKANNELVNCVHQKVFATRSVWQEGREDTQDRSHLREQILKVAYLCKQEGHHEIYNALLTDLAQLGSF